MNYNDVRESWMEDNKFLDNYEHYPKLVEEIINNFRQLMDNEINKRDTTEKIKTEVIYISWIMNNYEEHKLSIIQLFKNYNIEYKKLIVYKS